MIPKIIHYCWFDRSEKPELAKWCITRNYTNNAEVEKIYALME